VKKDFTAIKPKLSQGENVYNTVISVDMKKMFKARYDFTAELNYNKGESGTVM
jgi:hypothetical protein